jgi:Uma2 family endonuclease
MAIATPAVPQILTYEDYMTEGYVPGRYDIIEGVRVFMPGASYRHQRVQYWISRSLGDFEARTSVGVVLTAPFDVLIRRIPRLQTRQPDVLFVTHETLARGGGVPESGPLTVAPELAVEIISDSETDRLLSGKITDYVGIGVREAWIVRPWHRTVELLQLTTNGPVTIATCAEGDMLKSLVFADLTISVTDFFKP